MFSFQYIVAFISIVYETHNCLNLGTQFGLNHNGSPGAQHRRDNFKAWMGEFFLQRLLLSLTYFSIVWSSIANPISIHDGYGREGILQGIERNVIEKVNEFCSNGHVLHPIGWPYHAIISIFWPACFQIQRKQTLVRNTFNIFLASNHELQLDVPAVVD